MWTQIFPPSKKSNPHPYSNKKKQQLAKLSKYKLLILLISRYTYRVIKQSFIHVQRVTSFQKSLLQKLWAHIELSSKTTLRASMEKLKKNVLVSRGSQNKIKNMTTLLQRMTKYKLKKTFSSIALFSQRKNHVIFTNIDHMRKIIFCRKIEKILLSKKQLYLQNMRKYIIYLKKIEKNLQRAGDISRKLMKNLKQCCFNLLVRNMYLSLSKGVISVKKQIQQPQLRKRINAMDSDLESRDPNKSRLQQQNCVQKLDQTSINQNSFTEFATTYFINQKSGRKIVSARSRKIQNQSIESGLDFSIGSILGNSFTLSRSRSKDIRNMDSNLNENCNCQYRERYAKMKNTNQSLKNQLEIVKEELEVAKDLNDHFTNQIKQYFGGQKDTLQLDTLKKEIKDLHKQKQQLRIKVTKYQNHISILKTQFKLKIEELYRKVKRQR